MKVKMLEVSETAAWHRGRGFSFSQRMLNCVISWPLHHRVLILRRAAWEARSRNSDCVENILTIISVLSRCCGNMPVYGPVV
jgi:hypothetical protein